MLTEFGAAYNPTCVQDMTWMMQYLNQNAYNANDPAHNQGGFIGWTAWRANRHLSGDAFFNALQAENPNVSGGNGSSGGIVQGEANAYVQLLMTGT